MRFLGLLKLLSQNLKFISFIINDDTKVDISHKPALVALGHLVNITYMLFEGVQVGRFLSTICTCVIQLLRPVVLDMPIVAFEIC
jgi:hypothetical protein